MREVALGELMSLDIDRVPVDRLFAYKLAGVYSFGRGLFARDDLLGSETSYKYLHLLKPHQFVMSKLKAWEGAVTVVPSAFDGYVLSPEFPTYTPNRTAVVPEFLRLVTTWSPFWERMASQSRGIGGRRERVHQDRLLDVVIDLPDLDEQRRIVDIVAALGAVVDAAHSVGVAARSALDVLLDGWHDGYGGPVVRLGELADMASGPSWPASSERATPEPGDRRVLGITNTPSGDTLDLTGTKYVGGLPAATRLLGAGSLLMIRTNGNRTRIGNVYRVPDEAYGCTFSAFQIGIDLHNAQHADFVYWMLRSPRVQRAITDNASGTTGLGNIGVGWLRKLEIPWPSAVAQQEVVDLFDSLGQAALAARREAHAASEARSVVLTSLLLGEHQIPRAYDALLESV